jgi:hypothetical protein
MRLVDIVFSRKQYKKMDRLFTINEFYQRFYTPNWTSEMV